MNVLNRGLGKDKLTKWPIVRAIAKAAGHNRNDLAARLHEFNCASRNLTLASFQHLAGQERSPE